MRKFIYKILIFSSLSIPFFIILIIYNVWLDPFGVIRGDMQTQKTEPNQHYLKIKYCIDNPKKYNAFLFGSSRVGKIDVSKITDGNNWYNFTYSECVPYETLQDIRLLLHHNVNIKKIIIGLDEISYLVSHKLHKDQSLRKSYVNIINPYLYYLLLRPSLSMYENILNADTSRFYSKGAYSVIYSDGSFKPNKKDTFIETHPLIHIRDTVFNNPYWREYYSERIKQAIYEIAEIKQLSTRNNIKLIFFINPIYEKTYLKAIDNHFFLFLEQLSIITKHYDFSGINEITTNKLNYYENSHYRPIVGDWIINEITSSDKKYLIERGNIYSIIQKKMEVNKVRTHNNVYKSLGNK